MSLLASDVSMTTNFINMDQEESHQHVEKQQSEGTHQNKEEVAFFIERLPEKVHTFKVGKTRPNHIAYGKMSKIIPNVHS